MRGGVLGVFDASRYAGPIARAQLIPLLFGQSFQICALDRCSAGRNATLKEPDGRRVGWAETMESGSYL